MFIEAGKGDSKEKLSYASKTDGECRHLISAKRTKGVGVSGVHAYECASGYLHSVVVGIGGVGELSNAKEACLRAVILIGNDRWRADLIHPAYLRCEGCSATRLALLQLLPVPQVSSFCVSAAASGRRLGYYRASVCLARGSSCEGGREGGRGTPAARHCQQYQHPSGHPMMHLEISVSDVLQVLKHCNALPNV